MINEFSYIITDQWSWDYVHTLLPLLLQATQKTKFYQQTLSHDLREFYSTDLSPCPTCKTARWGLWHWWLNCSTSVVLVGYASSFSHDSSVAILSQCEQCEFFFSHRRESQCSVLEKSSMMKTYSPLKFKTKNNFSQSNHYRTLLPFAILPGKVWMLSL